MKVDTINRQILLFPQDLLRFASVSHLLLVSPSPDAHQSACYQEARNGDVSSDARCIIPPSNVSLLV